MNVLIITFRLDGIDEVAYRRLVEPAVPRIVRVPGLVAKLFLADQPGNTYGGAYLFESREAIERYLDSDLIRELSADPHITDLSTRIFDTIASLTELTQGRLPLYPIAPAA